jgi:hypothetical protein
MAMAGGTGPRAGLVHGRWDARVHSVYLSIGKGVEVLHVRVGKGLSLQTSRRSTSLLRTAPMRKPPPGPRHRAEGSGELIGEGQFGLISDVDWISGGMMLCLCLIRCYDAM